MDEHPHPPASAAPDSTIQKTEYYNDLLNNNHVKSFTTRDNCDFYTRNMILNLCNKINYL